MKTIHLLIGIMLMMHVVYGQLLISEVYYDPLNESGSEFVELYNPTDQSISLEGWVIGTESSLSDAVMSNAMIPPSTYYLVADEGFASGKDEELWPDADYEDKITMANTDSGIGLFVNGTLIDAVGWGNAAGISDNLYEGSPVPGAGGGWSIQRNLSHADTDENTQDFFIGIPSPQGSHGSDAIILPTRVEVVEGMTANLSLMLSPDDDPLPGIQIDPLPGRNKSIILGVTATPGVDKLTSVFRGQEDDLEEESPGHFATTLALSYADLPGDYVIEVYAYLDNEVVAGENLTFTYTDMIGYSIDSTGIDFLAAEKGSTVEIPGDQSLATPERPTLKNIGNVPVHVGISGSSLSSTSNTLPPSFITALFGTQELSLTESITYFSHVVMPGTSSETALGFRLALPNNAAPGIYQGNIYISGSANEE